MLLREQQWYYLTHSWDDKGVQTFAESICLKVNVIARLEFEFSYYKYRSPSIFLFDIFVERQISSLCVI